MKSKIFVVTAIVALGFVPVLFRELFGASSLALGLFVIVSFILVFSLKFLIVEKVFRLQKIFVFFYFFNLHIFSFRY
jgi:hypothetical protein